MPEDGDTVKAYCDVCEKVVTWVYVSALFRRGWWKCAGCDMLRDEE
jgi:hypothetical protein